LSKLMASGIRRQRPTAFHTERRQTPLPTSAKHKPNCGYSVRSERAPRSQNWERPHAWAAWINGFNPELDNHHIDMDKAPAEQHNGIVSRILRTQGERDVRMSNVHIPDVIFSSACRPDKPAAVVAPSRDDASCSTLARECRRRDGPRRTRRSSPLCRGHYLVVLDQFTADGPGRALLAWTGLVKFPPWSWPGEFS
jgi:hypothetical protein